MNGRRCSLALAAVLLAALAAAAPAHAIDTTLVAAGDIACPPSRASDATQCQQQATADLAGSLAPTAIAILGDNQYEDTSAADPFDYGPFDASWGALAAPIHPVPGNHEYHDQTGGPAQSYFDHFGAAAGNPAKGWYSYDLGAWHLVALNSAYCAGSSCANVSAPDVPPGEVTWLQQDLAAHAGQCVLAYWHQPRFASSNDVFGAGASNPEVAPLWDTLYDHHADVVLNGHEHNYERFAQQDKAANPDAAGPREFVVGTGGEDHHDFSAPPTEPLPTSEARDAAHFGVLLLTLRPGGYDWVFLRTDGVVGDSGSTACHSNRPPVAALDVSPAAPVPGQDVRLDASRSSDPEDGAVAAYAWDLTGDGRYADATTPTVTTRFAAGPHDVGVLVRDRDGAQATARVRIDVAPTPVPVTTPVTTPQAVPPRCGGRALRTLLRGLVRAVLRTRPSRMTQASWTICLPRAGRLRVVVRPHAHGPPLLVAVRAARPGRTRVALRRAHGTPVKRLPSLFWVTATFDARGRRTSYEARTPPRRR